VREIPAVRVYPTDDENVAIAEWSVRGGVVSNGNPYDMSYATFRDGLIVDYREYWNPQVFLNALAGANF
jgi:ketosteroid isomerase-like protein